MTRSAPAAVLLAQFLNRSLHSRKLLDDHCAGRKDNWLQIWTLLGLSIWDDLFCRRPITATQARFATAVGAGA